MALFKSLTYMFHAPSRQWARFDKVVPYALDAEFGGNEEGKGAAYGLKREGDRLAVTTFDGTEDADPRQWSPAYKAFVLANITLIAALITYVSAISSATAESMVEEFKVSLELAELTTALFLIGFALGALPVAPLSEKYGRQPVYLVTFLAASAFIIGTGASRTWAGVLVCRFFSGFFGAAVLAVAGGSVNDIYDPVERGYAFPVYAGVSFMGPMAAPVIGSAISQFWSWRWNYYLCGIIGFAMLLFLCAFCPETLADVILFEKGERIWRTTEGRTIGGLVVKRPRRKAISLNAFFHLVVLKALKLLIFEPVIIYLTVLLSLVYFMFFGCLEAFPVIYGDIHGLEPYQVGLCFLPILVGTALAILGSMPFAWHYAKEARLNKIPPPESRLVPLIIGGLILPVSLFWLGWAGGYSSTSIWASILSGLGLGFSTVFIFIGTCQMLIDTYKANASSALAANVLVRYLCAGGAVMAARPMFTNMQPQWACTLLGCVALAMVPFSFLFYLKGESFRKRSRYAPHDK